MVHIPPNNNHFILIHFLDKLAGEYLQSYPIIMKFHFPMLSEYSYFLSKLVVQDLRLEIGS
jgi:hypothetical protein